MTSLALPAARLRSMLHRPSRRTLITTGALIVAVVAVKGLLLGLADAHVYNFSTPLPAVLLGAIIGMTYGLLAVGLVLIYRTNRIINFAHGQIGAFGAAVFGLIVVKYHVPYWITFPFALLAAALVGATAETGVVRRLRKAPKLISVVATLGVGQFVVSLAYALNSTASAGANFPQPSFLPSFRVGGLLVTPAYSGMLILSPIVVALLAGFLRFSRFGLALRSAAANPEAARMSGIFAARMSTLAWAIAGALSAFAAILTQPTQGFTSANSFGPTLLLRAMTAAVVARMQSLPAALAAGVGLGVIEELLNWQYQGSGLPEACLFVIILAALLLQRRRGGRDEEKSSWAAVEAFRPLPEALRRIWLVRNLGLITGLVVLAFAGCLPLFVSNTTTGYATTIIAFGIVGLSVSVLTGLGGQLTLGQFMFGAIGAVIAYYVARNSGDYALAFVYAGVGAAIVSVLIGVPALRIRGLMLTVTTLAFALAGYYWLLNQPWALGSQGVTPRPPTVDGKPLDTGHSYYYLAFFVLVVCLLLARNVRRSGFGRLLVAIRDNEDNARAFTVPASAVKLQGYLFAGFLAGIGGAIWAGSLSNVSFNNFPVDYSIQVVVMTVMGGVSLLAGPFIGALYVKGIPLLPLDAAGTAATQFGALLVVLLLPRGLGSLLSWPRDRLARRIGRWYGVHLDEAEAGGQPAAPAADTGALPARPATVRVSELVVPGQARDPGGGTLLEARGLVKHFGGIAAVDGVSLRVRYGETLGLIGPNGAGKTTTFELLGGFTRADDGEVVFDQQDVTFLGPEARARLGLIRSFQDAALFPTMTVLEAVQLGLERTSPTRFLSSVAGLTFAERRKERRARELVAAMGLDSYRDKQIQELSTGTRRITEIACLMALQPKLLLLDEPSSGIAQRETEALGGLLADLKRQLGLTLVVIEHDIPLIMGISDRIVAMADGKVITSGSPEEVRAHPGVVEAYLGGSQTAIERSTHPAPAERVPVGSRG